MGLAKARIALAESSVKSNAALSSKSRLAEKLAEIEVELKALELTCMRIAVDLRRNGPDVYDPRSSILKLKGSELLQLKAQMLMELAGPAAMARRDAYLQGGDQVLVEEPWAATSAPFATSHA